MQRLAYSEAIAFFDQCLENKPLDPHVYFQRGTCYLLLKKPNIALVDFNQALRLDSGLYESYYNRGLAQQALNNYTFAEADFLLYHARVPSDVKVLRNLARLMEDMLDYPAAIRYYTEYLNQKPGDVTLRKSRALAFASIDSTDAAVRDLNICLKPSANDTGIWLCKGNVYFDAMLYNQAIDAYNVVLLGNPEHRGALINRADAYTAAGRYEEAMRDYRSLSQKDRYNPEYHFNLGFCALQLNQNQEAVLNFGKALDTGYENIGQLLTLRGVAFNNMQLQAEACSDWLQALNAGYREAENYRKNYCK